MVVEGPTQAGHKVSNFTLPVEYDRLSATEKGIVRGLYTKQQGGLCLWCKQPLTGAPPAEVTRRKINFKLFPPGFLKNPVHLQHDHNTGLTEGVVHAYCNAVMWQYHGR